MPTPACPVCGKTPGPDASRFRPFCCARCADVDLGRWITGQYRVPGLPEDEMSEEPPEPS